MSQDIYNFAFSDQVSSLQAHATFALALTAVRSLHGAVAVGAECRFHCDRDRRLYHIHCSTPIGNDLARIFAGFCFHAYGPEAVRVRRGYADSFCKPQSAGKETSLLGGLLQ